MGVTRREFMAQGAGIAAAATVGALTAGCVRKASEKAPAVIAACGLACDACPVMKAGKCKGCGPAPSISTQVVAEKNCPVLTCASKKNVPHCGTGCEMYAKCSKMIGKPYSESFMAMIAKRLG